MPFKIVDLTRALSGPWATQHLADQGFDVVKVEPPGGDETRGFGPHVGGHSTYFLSTNRNKRSIVLDLRTPAGMEVLYRLLDDADLLVENYRPGVAERLGFGWAELHPRYPKLVYVAICAFGDDGPAEWTSRPGYDMIVQAMGGSMAVTGLPELPPLRSGLSVADLLSGLLATQGALLGLLHREKTGQTQKIVVNMMQAQVTALAYHATKHTIAGEDDPPRGNAHRGLVPYDTFRCLDGWLVLGCGNDRMWSRLARALAIPELPEWAKNADRIRERANVDRAVSEALGRLTVAEADRLLAEAEVPAGPVLTVGQALTHPVVDMLTLPHPDLGTIRVPGPPIQTSTTRETHTHPPKLGEQQAEILAELGYASDDVARLRAAGAFGP